VPDSILGALWYTPKDHYWCLSVGWQLGRLEFLSGGHESFDEQTKELVDKAATEAVDAIKGTLAPVGVSLLDEADSFREVSERFMNDTADRYGPEHVAFVLLGMAGLRLALASDVDSFAKQTEMRQLATSCLTNITGVYVADKEALFNRIAEAAIQTPAQLADLLMHIQREEPQAEQSPHPAEDDKITVLFAAADPSDETRLRLGEEFRNIQQMLQIARFRDRYHLATRMSIRVPDLTQAILDENPRIFHFSGHGTSDGFICLEDVTGKAQDVAPEALANLFRTAGGVECVVLNAWFSAVQAKAITQVVPYVVGMQRKVGDAAAIAFAVGFYQALGAGRSIPDAFAFGVVQLGLLNIPESLTPQLLSRT
jgi:hypothetical protein